MKGLRVWFQKMSPLSLKPLDLEKKQNLDIELEVDWLAISKWDISDFRGRQYKTKSNRVVIFIHATLIDEIEFTDHWYICNLNGL